MVLLTAMLLVVGQLLAGCADEPERELIPVSSSLSYAHFVDIYITDDAKAVSLGGPALAGDVWLYPLDILYINNISSGDAKITFKIGMFDILDDVEKSEEDGRMTLTIKERRRVRLMVIKGGLVDNAFDIQTSSGLTTHGSPRVKIGDGP
jgi:hypothetical protein